MYNNSQKKISDLINKSPIDAQYIEKLNAVNIFHGQLDTILRRSISELVKNNVKNTKDLNQWHQAYANFINTHGIADRFRNFCDKAYEALVNKKSLLTKEEFQGIAESHFVPFVRNITAQTILNPQDFLNDNSTNTAKNQNNLNNHQNTHFRKRTSSSSIEVIDDDMSEQNAHLKNQSKKPVCPTVDDERNFRSSFSSSSSIEVINDDMSEQNAHLKNQSKKPVYPTVDPKAKIDYNAEKQPARPLNEQARSFFGFGNKK